jgi:hypothetical protein
MERSDDPLCGSPFLNGSGYSLTNLSYSGGLRVVNREGKLACPKPISTGKLIELRHLTLFYSGSKLCDLMGSLEGLVQGSHGLFGLIALNQAGATGDGRADRQNLDPRYSHSV